MAHLGPVKTNWFLVGGGNFNQRSRVAILQQSKCDRLRTRWLVSHKSHCGVIVVPPLQMRDTTKTITLPDIQHTFRPKQNVIFGHIIPDTFHYGCQASIVFNRTDDPERLFEQFTSEFRNALQEPVPKRNKCSRSTSLCTLSVARITFTL